MAGSRAEITEVDVAAAVRASAALDFRRFNPAPNFCGFISKFAARVAQSHPAR